jgi:hypothetical protein
MAGEKTPGGRRPVPTIDLTASEVASEPEKTADPAASDPAAMRGDESVRPEPPEAPADTPPADGSERAKLFWPISAGVAAAVLLILIVVSGTHMWTVRDDVALLSARLAATDLQLRELAGRPAPPNVEGKVEELAVRAARIEAALARPPATDAALVARIAAAENTTKSLAESIAGLNRRVEEIAAREARADVARPAEGQALDQGELEILAKKIAALETTAKSIEGELAKPSADRALRRAVVAAALQAAVERGDPFVAEFAAAKPLAGDRLAPLEPFARSGLPSVPALVRELHALTASMLPTGTSKPRDGGLLERLQANAERFVRIRPVGDAAGDDPAAIVARIESKGSDLAAALAELRKLPAEQRAPAEAWIRKAEARIAAVALSRQFAADAMDALGKS